MSLKITKSLKLALSHLYCREACDQEGWAYVTLENIDIHDNVVVFAKGSHKLNIRLPALIVVEIKKSASSDHKVGLSLTTLHAR